MHRASQNVRRALALDKKLQENFTRRCSLLRDTQAKTAAAALAPSPLLPAQQFVPKLCHTLGQCVCGDNADPEHMFRNLVRHFKHFFADPKCGERKLLNKRLVVLKFQPRAATHNGFAPIGPAQDDCDEAYSSEAAFLGLQDDVESFFVHIGHANLSTWRLSFLELGLAPESRRATKMEWDLLAPPLVDEVGDSLAAFTDVEFFRKLDLTKPWMVTVMAISGLLGPCPCKLPGQTAS